MKKIISVFIIALCFILASCTKYQSYDIYTTNYPLFYLASSITKDKYKVSLIAGAQSHNSSIEWTGKKLISLLDAELLFYNGAGLDDYIDKEIKVIDKKNVELYKMEDYIDFIDTCNHHDHDHEEDENKDTHEDDDSCSVLYHDPHFFLDPVLIIEASKVIYDAIIKTWPEDKEIFEKNYQELKKALDDLAKDYDEALTGATKPILTTSNLYGYYHERYGLESIPISNSSHSSNEIISDYMKFVNEAKKHNIKYIIFEKNANSTYGDSIIQELNTTPNYNCQKLYFHTLESLSNEDTLNKRNYLTIMYENLEILKKAIE